MLSNTVKDYDYCCINQIPISKSYCCKLEFTYFCHKSFEVSYLEIYQFDLHFFFMKSFFDTFFKLILIRAGYNPVTVLLVLWWRSVRRDESQKRHNSLFSYLILLILPSWASDFFRDKLLLKIQHVSLCSVNKILIKKQINVPVA